MELRDGAPNVLIVAHSPELLYACRSVCDHLDWDGQAVTAGAFVRERPSPTCDLIIAESEIPGLDITELLRSMRGQFPNVPIVVLSGAPPVPHGSALFAAGATSILSSNSSEQTLVEVLQTVVSAVPAGGSPPGLDTFCQATLSLETAAALQQRIPLMLADTLENEGFMDESLRRRLDLAFQEALTNSLEHGNLELSSAWREVTDAEGADKYSAVKSLRLADPHFARRKVVISFEFRDDIYSIRLRDEGPGFTPPPKDLLVVQANSEKCSGRGLAIIANSVDELIFSNSGREVVMRKRLRRSAAQRTGA